MTVILILIEINLVLLVKFRLVCFHAGRTLLYSERKENIYSGEDDQEFVQ